MTAENQVVLLSRLAGQLYADMRDVIDNEQQALQVIADYFEKVGEIALAGQSHADESAWLDADIRAEASEDY